MNNYNDLTELNKLIYNAQTEICDNCKGIDKCKQDTVGITPIIARNYITDRKLTLNNENLRPNNVKNYFKQW
jgi:hypothetical protein